MATPKKKASKKTPKKTTAAQKTAKKQKQGPAKRPAPAKKPAARAQKTAKKQAPAKQPAKKAPAKAATKTTPAKKPEAPKPDGKAQKAAEKKPSLLERKVPARKPGSVICPLSGFEVMPTTPNLSPKTVDRLRRRLVDERDRHLRQAEELQAEADALAMERDPGDTQFDEESGEGDTVNVERERDLLLSASARQIVEAIDRALVRIEAGTYGLCVPAGRRIALERLEAIPYAEECVDCKARAERRR
ncbi:MAG TPA: TraR/DksA C4-type zinc finger protein [Acidimicrobiia bacterium]